jgi:hypothetical protein
MMAQRTLLDNRHPDYARLAPEWQFWQQSYEGGALYQEAGHLFRFPKETRSNYVERLKRASRMNFTRQVLDLLIQYLSKEVPERKKDQAPKAVLDFWEDADRKGTTIDDFMKDVALLAGLFGSYYVMVDKPADVAENKLEQDARKLKPYAYGINPLDVLDLVHDTTSGEIVQVLIREYVRGPVSLLESRDSDTLQERFRLWVKTDEGILWILFRQDAEGNPEELERGLASIQRIPLVEVKRIGGSVIADIATLDRKVYNYDSLLDQILYEQTFSTLRLPWNGRMEEFYEQWELTLGTKSILPYDPTAGAAPDFIAPDSSQGELILKAIDQAVIQIYRAKNLLDTVGASLPKSTTASGIARGYDFEKLNAGLATFADNLEKAEEELAVLVSLWEGVNETLPPDLIDYPDAFDVKTLLQALEEARLLAQSVASDTFRKLMQKRLVKKAVPKLDTAEFMTVMAEIDTVRTIPENQTGS